MLTSFRSAAPWVCLGVATVAAAVALHNVYNSPVETNAKKHGHAALLGARATELDKHFAHASAYVSANPKPSPSNEDKLVLYAFFKQATAGDCTAAAPSAVDFVAKAKWDAWHGLVGMPIVEAKKRYLEVVSSLFRDYSYGRAIPPISADAISEGESDGGGGDDVDMGFTPPMSQEIVDKTTKEWQVEENAFHFAKTGQMDAVQTLLASADHAIDTKDDEGRTMLHWAVDRDQADVVASLLAQGADVNATVCTTLPCAGVDVIVQDNDGMTPLHYAISCEHVPLIDLLLDHGADPHVEDQDGETPFAYASAAIRTHITEVLERLEAN
ncbi:Aste57867_2396 [Aphanomyces stellatus]|uniref:Aste57867_2396 protein n=1 Tax=Aphanomyces stellatus TaxID=120398 RepID=A0A485K8J4_9STRA|nr:hypothetical protein As57867_002390 [Aphanomyces stellatus]VFT79597.1 Aste57867_2396 [Aphanomyces stellatus]